MEKRLQLMHFWPTQSILEFYFRCRNKLLTIGWLQAERYCRPTMSSVDA